MNEEAFDRVEGFQLLMDTSRTFQAGGRRSLCMPRWHALRAF
jgi:hypothetical protein